MAKTKSDLYQEAQDRGLDVKWSMTKAQIQEILNSSEEDVDEPAWKQNQQKTTGAAKKESVNKTQRGTKPGFVKIKMHTDYRHFAKKGEIWETTETKAKELVDLGRAEYVS